PPSFTLFPYTTLFRSDQAATHNLKHVLTRVLGASADQMGADAERVFLSDGDQVLLCTDGLTDMVSLAAITAVLRLSQSSQAACRSEEHTSELQSLAYL